jgi:hypothetical protein
MPSIENVFGLFWKGKTKDVRNAKGSPPPADCL